MIEKYVGWVVEIIYQDRKGHISHRKIEVRQLRDGKLFARCLTANALRTFRIDGILAVQPIGNKAKRKGMTA